MSFILDALKKSDQKRQEGKVPDLQTISEETKLAKPKRLPWPLLLAAVLFANTAVISLWFFTRDSKNPEPISGQQLPATEAQQTPAAQAAPPGMAKPPAPQPGIPAVPAVPGTPGIAAFQPGRTVDPVVVGQPQKPMLLPNANGAKVSAPQNASAPSTGATPPTQRPMPPLQPTPAMPSGGAAVAPAPTGQQALESAPAQSPTVEADMPEEAIEEEESLPEDLLPEEPLDSHAQPENAPPSSQAGQKDTSKKMVLDIRQLPGPVQSKLPKFHISAHFYSSNPPSRLASVNGRVMREGQNLSPGLTLQEITPEGIVFSFEGHIFQVNTH